MNKQDNSSVEGLIVSFLLFLTISMLLIKWEWYIDIPYWIVFAPIYLPIITTIVVVFILSIINPKQIKND